MDNLQNLLTPAIMFFSLGMVAQLIRSDLKLPADLTKSLTIYLLLSVGIHGGIELSHTNFGDALPSIIVALCLGFTFPLIAYWVINRIGKIDRRQLHFLRGLISIMKNNRLLCLPLWSLQPF